MTNRFERSIREFFTTGRITDSYSINTFGELLDFAKAFYPEVWWYGPNMIISVHTTYK